MNHPNHIVRNICSMLSITCAVCANAQQRDGAEQAMLDRFNAGETTVQAGFEENNGQVKTTSGDPAPFVRFRLSQGGTSIFLLENGIAYQFERWQYPDGYMDLVRDRHSDASRRAQLNAMRGQVRLETFRMDMVLEGSDPDARISTEGRSEDYTNYYNHDALDVRSFSRITYHDVYPGIDWVVYTTEEGMKYDFIVRPGADPSVIKIRCKHHEELRVDEHGQLIHGNRLGRFTELKPVSFQEGKEVETRFVLEDDALHFEVQGHDRSRSLTIDPARIWGTYYGNVDADYGYGCKVDGSGNIYMSGFSESTTGIADGGHQLVNGGDMDGMLVKFAPSGARLWATYYGGAGLETGTGCSLSSTGDIYMSGLTESTASIASGGHQNVFGGGAEDGYLVKFNSAGVRQWATYYGGAGDDEAEACATDASGFVYIGGQTNSVTGIAASGHQGTFGGGSDGDGFVAKFDAAGTRIWGTYYGGSGDDVVVGITVGSTGNVHVSGITGSTASIASGGHQNSYGGGVSDAFLAKLNGSCVLQWATYYGGAGMDEGFRTSVDASGNVFLAGLTDAVSGIAISGHQTVYGGGLTDGFLVKLDPTGARLWGTYYGGSDFELAVEPAINAAGDVYLCGYSSSSNAIASGGHQNTFGGDVDAFLVKFNGSAVRLWATYYGGTLQDGAVAIALDPTGYVYIAGVTESATAIGSGGFQNTFGGGFSDGMLVKFDDSTVPCTENLTIEIETDGNGSETSWQIVLQGTSTVVASGPAGSYPNYAILTEPICLPVGCYELRVLDSGGNGITDGGYVLRNAAGRRIIDSRDNGNFTSVSQVSASLGFCLPISAQALTIGTTDREDLLTTDQVIASPVAAVSAQYPVSSNSDLSDDGYQFWIFDPHGTYNRRVFLSHAAPGTGGGSGATAACHLRLNFTPVPVPLTVLLNVRVRNRVNGVNSEWGPASRLRVNPYPLPCPTTRLVDLPGSPNYSCNTTFTFAASDNVVCYPVAGATLYQFQFENALEGYLRNITSTSTARWLNWSTVQPLCGIYEYQVRVRASFDGGTSYCDWGASCPVWIVHMGAGCTSAGSEFTEWDQRQVIAEPAPARLVLYPNPADHRGFWISLDGVDPEATLLLELYDQAGRCAHQQWLPAMARGVNTLVVPPASMATGTYLVRVQGEHGIWHDRVVLR